MAPGTFSWLITHKIDKREFPMARTGIFSTLNDRIIFWAEIMDFSFSSSVKAEDLLLLFTHIIILLYPLSRGTWLTNSMLIWFWDRHLKIWPVSTLSETEETIKALRSNRCRIPLMIFVPIYTFILKANNRAHSSEWFSFIGLTAQGFRQTVKGRALFCCKFK